jgi:hypothetical protein
MMMTVMLTLVRCVYTLECSSRLVFFPVTGLVTILEVCALEFQVCVHLNVTKHVFTCVCVG